MMMKVAEIFLAVGLFVQSPVCRMHNFGNKDVINGSGFVKFLFHYKPSKSNNYVLPDLRCKAYNFIFRDMVTSTAPTHFITL